MSGGETSAESLAFRPLTDPALLREAFGWSSSAPGWFRAASDYWGLDFCEYLRRVTSEGSAVGVFDRGVMIGVCALWRLDATGVIPGVMELHLCLRPSYSRKALGEMSPRLIRFIFSRLPDVRALAAWVCSRNTGALSLARSAGFTPTGRAFERGSYRGRPLRWVELVATRRARAVRPAEILSPSESEGWSCAYYAAMNLCVLYGLKPPALDELRAWVAEKFGAGKAQVSDPKDPRDLASYGLTVYEQALMLLNHPGLLGLPPASFVALSPSHTMRDVLPEMLREGRAAVLSFRMRFGEYLCGYSAVAFRTCGEYVECLDSVSYIWHGRVLPWHARRRHAFLTWGYERLAGRPHGCVARYRWDTLPEGAPRYANGERKPSPLGIERQFILIG